MAGTILIVDDMAAGQLALEGLLLSEGYQLAFASSGAEALTQATALLPDLILLDVMMPGMDGYEVCRHLRADPILREVPVILLTALDDRDSRLQGLEAGADDFISKPFDRIELKTRLRSILRLNRYRHLLAARANFERVVELSPSGIIVIDRNGLILFANPALLGMLMLGQEQVIGQSWRNFIIPEQADESVAKLRVAALHGLPSVQFETEFICGNGKRIAVDISAGSFIWNNLPATQVVVRDITERKRSERHIREQAELLDKTQDAIILKDLDNKIIFWNRAATKLYGWSAEEVLNREVESLFYKTIPASYREALRVVKERGEWIGELSQQTRDGKSIIVQSRWTIVRNEQGEIVSKLIVNTDITEKKRMEEQVLRAQRMESIGTLASGIAHDLNNVLAPILMSVQILKNRFPDDRSHRILNSMEEITQRGADLIKQVLSFGRGIEGKLAVLQIKHLIIEVEKVVRETFPRSIEIQVDLPRELNTISADATQMHQMLMNFCVNARDAMLSGGRLTISANNFYVDENYARMNIDAVVGPYVVVTIADSGIGIPADIRDRIFEPFFTTKEAGKGTGLGLSTVLGIIKGHGGFITVYSEPNKGTQFKVYLPASEMAEPAAPQREVEQLPIGNGELILIVDDEASIREITKATLESFQYRTLLACDGTEAVALYVMHRHEISIVLTDMMMPIMDGSTTIRALRRINPEIKIVAVSGIVTEEKVNEAIRSGAQTLLAKPFTAEELIRALHKVLKG